VCYEHAPDSAFPLKVWEIEKKMSITIHTVECIEIGERVFRLPYADLLPPLGTDDYADLRDDIAKRGIIVPVVLDERNNVIDGQHRVRIAAELGLTSVPVEIKSGLDLKEELSLAWDLNAHRRHMTKEHRQEWAAKLREQGMSYRQIGQKLGVDHKTVRADIRASGGEFSPPQRVIGQDGKQYTASRPAPRYTNTADIDQSAPGEGDFDQTPDYEEPVIRLEDSDERQAAIEDASREMWGTPKFPSSAAVTCPNPLCKVHHKGWIWNGSQWVCDHCGSLVADGVLCATLEREEEAFLVKVGAQPDAPKLGTHQLMHSSESNEWYTPVEVIEAARANRVVQASAFYSLDDDGLAHVWAGNVWLNPPYGKDEDNVSNVAVWSAHLIDAYEFGRVEQALLLVNAVPDRSWFDPLWNYPICFFSARIKFYTEDGRKPQPTHANAVVYLGKPENVKQFAQQFGRFGRIVVPQGDYSECLRRS
jgi:hypothetical protein